LLRIRLKRSDGSPQKQSLQLIDAKKP